MFQRSSIYKQSYLLAYLLLACITICSGNISVQKVVTDTIISVDSYDEKVIIIGAPVNITLPSASLHNTLYHFVPMSYPNQYIATLVSYTGETIFGSTNNQNTYSLSGMGLISDGISDYLLVYI